MTTIRTTIRPLVRALRTASGLFAMAALPLLVAAAPPVLAQESASGERRARAGGPLEEVVVSARRRAENQQEVPIAITALSDEFLRVNAVGNFDQIRHYTPALTISNGGTSVNTPVISLRGQRASEGAIHLESAVPMYMSDVVLTPAAGTNLLMYDLESVQVLKGPQGTLFGRNSTGGALLFTPRRPGDAFGGHAEVTVGNYDRFSTEIGVDLPASERLKFRVAAKTVDRDPYQENVGTNPLTMNDEYWDEKSRAVRFSALAQPTDRFENLLVAAWDENQTLGLQPRLEAYNRTSRPLPHLADDLQRSLARDPMKVESDQPGQRESVENWFVANTTEYRFEHFTLKNIFGYRNVDMESVYDADGSAEAIANMSGDGIPAVTKAETFSNEIQLLGTALGDRLDWITGLYYWQLEGTRYSRSSIFGLFDNIQGGDADNSAWAVFAQGSYDVTDRLGITAGIRYSVDDRELTVKNHRVMGGRKMCQVRGTDNVQLPAASCSRTVEDDWDAITWLLSADYELTDGTMAYGSVTTGYRAGGFNIRGNTNSELQPFDEESVITYELGVKSDWHYGGWSFRTNLAAYHQDFDDIQRTVSLPDPDGLTAFITLTRNAAKASIQGAEVEFHASSDFGLDLTLNYAYVDTEYEDYIDQLNVDQSGESIEWVPQDQFTASLRYTLPLDPQLGEISLMANYYYQSEQLATLYTGFDPIEDRVKQVDSYSLSNYSLDWRSVMGSSFDLTLFVKNAEDKRYAVGGLTVVESLGVALWNYGEPRTFGAALRYNF